MCSSGRRFGPSGSGKGLRRPSSQSLQASRGPSWGSSNVAGSRVEVFVLSERSLRRSIARSSCRRDGRAETSAPAECSPFGDARGGCHTLRGARWLGPGAGGVLLRVRRAGRDRCACLARRIGLPPRHRAEDRGRRHQRPDGLRRSQTPACCRDRPGSGLACRTRVDVGCGCGREDKPSSPCSSPVDAADEVPGGRTCDRGMAQAPARIDQCPGLPVNCFSHEHRCRRRGLKARPASSVVRTNAVIACQMSAHRSVSRPRRAVWSAVVPGEGHLARKSAAFAVRTSMTTAR